MSCSTGYLSPTRFAIALVFLSVGAGCQRGAAARSQANGDTVSARPAVYVSLSEHRWGPLDPSNPSSPQIAVLWGDPTTGPYGALLRFPAGFKSPMHRHSLDEYTVTVQGEILHWTEEESEANAKPMPPGSYTLIKGNVNHISACAPRGPECIDFLTQAGPFDFTLAR